MDENRERITVMDRDRRMLQRHYTFIFIFSIAKDIFFEIPVKSNFISKDYLSFSL